MSQPAASETLEGDGGGGAGCGGGPLHARPFKLRFAPQREPGRSYITPNKPLGLPAPLAGECRGGGEARAAGERAALRHLQQLCARGPRDLYHRPHLSSHDYGWWCELSRQFGRGDYGLRDSHWLKTRARLLHHDALLSGK